ncbi:MAG TPA: hypothetical protein VG733_06540 [Chthoniobacteraceae bacterium]|nr:hypothetical protein [Chthoniobacteraceae bacterium]
MHTSKVSGIIASLALFSSGLIPALRADDADTTAMLCERPWEVVGSASYGYWARVRIFKDDGTFTTKGSDAESGKWTIESNSILLTFLDKHIDSISLPLDPEGVPGADAYGEPTFCTQLPPNPVPPDAGEQKALADLANACGDEIVAASGSNAYGNGFIAAMGKSNFVFACTRTLAAIPNAAFKTANGNAPVQTGGVSLAVGRDVACLAAASGGKPLEFMQDVDKNAAVGDDVAVLAGTPGQPGVTPFFGKILAIHPDHIEINAQYPGDVSGSPIFHLKTGKVVGMATGAMNWIMQASLRQGILPVRRYGCRLDNIKGWQNLDWRIFNAQQAELDKIGQTTDDLESVFRDIGSKAGIIALGQYKSYAVQVCFEHWKSAQTGKLNEADRKKVDGILLTELKSISQADVTAARPHMSYDYWQRALAGQQKARDALDKGLDKLIARVSDLGP